jgi:hypothetical protein
MNNQLKTFYLSQISIWGMVLFLVLYIVAAANYSGGTFLDKVDDLGMVVILNYFHFGQDEKVQNTGGQRCCHQVVKPKAATQNVGATKPFFYYNAHSATNDPLVDRAYTFFPLNPNYYTLKN